LAFIESIHDEGQSILIKGLKNRSAGSVVKNTRTESYDGLSNTQQLNQISSTVQDIFLYRSKAKNDHKSNEYNNYDIQNKSDHVSKPKKKSKVKINSIPINGSYNKSRLRRNKSDHSSFIPWALLDELDAEKRRFESEREQVEKSLNMKSR
jgi:hypothetical protein